MVKKMIRIGMLLVMLFAVTGCDGTGEDWHALIDELQQRTERQDERISELEEENAKYAEKLKQLEEENKALEDRIKELEKPVCTCYLLEPDIKAAFDFADPKDKPLDLADFDFDHFVQTPQYIDITFKKIREDKVCPILELRHFCHVNLKALDFIEPIDLWRGGRQTAVVTEVDTFDRNAVIRVIRYFEMQCFVKGVKLSNYLYPI